MDNLAHFIEKKGKSVMNPFRVIKAALNEHSEDYTMVIITVLSEQNDH